MKTFYILVPTQKGASPLKIYQAEYYLIKHDNWCYYKGVKLLLRTNRWRKSKRSDINNLLILLIRLVLRVSSSYTSTLGLVSTYKQGVRMWVFFILNYVKKLHHNITAQSKCHTWKWKENSSPPSAFFKLRSN